MLPNCDLPGEIMVEILSRLPVKSLIRFRCVCKSWYPLLTNPNFIIMHLNHSKFSTTNDSHKLVVRLHNRFTYFTVFSLYCGEPLSDSPVDLHIPFTADIYDLGIVGSCNGLLCVLLEQDTVLWNPATRQFRFLPELECPVWPISMGFGFHPNTDDYKFVRIASYEDAPLMITQVEVYTFSSNSWKEIEVAVPGLIFENSSTASLQNGFLHWMAYGTDREIIVSFDLGDEVFREIAVPDSHGISFEINRKLSVLKESLSVIVYSTAEEKNICFDIWVMNEYGVEESWTKQFTVGPLLTVSKPLGFWKNGEVIFNYEENLNNVLFLYDPSAQEMKDFLTHGTEYSYEVYNYVESLVLI
uniref:F-box domain-containing protein n=1 Tax=Davidia involucrata TaxID=16924 RepID=A0A5B6YQ60_DAVIN